MLSFLNWSYRCVPWIGSSFGSSFLLRLLPLSVSIEGELAPCLEPSGYLFNIVTNEALGEVGEIDDARS